MACTDDLIGQHSLGCRPKGVASRNCWATHGLLGCRVTPTCTTRHEANAITKKANNGQKSRSVTGKKSAA
jgi:hypothetical protein